MKNTIILLLWMVGGPFLAQANTPPPPPDTIKTAVQLAQVKTYCFDTTQLAGVMVSFENLCPASSGTFVNFVEMPSEYCISYGGMELGVESACLKYCDDQGMCDTTIFVVTTVPDTVSTLWPIAVDDVALTHENEPVNIDVIDNDVLPNNNAFLSLKIIDNANHGTTVVGDDGLVTYTPENGFCGAVDTFQYEICNIAGCDSATVFIDVATCFEFDGIHVFNGFSPNDDGFNDTWRVLGLEDYPNNEVIVFNRWGNQIFKTKNYNSDWNGQWEQKALPAGTYFYIVNDGVNKKYTGSLEIGY